MPNFPGSPVARVRASKAGGTGSTSGQGTKIPHTAWDGWKTNK